MTALRATPPTVLRLNRRTLAILFAVLSAAVLGAALRSLQSVEHRRGPAPELHNVDRVSKAENLARLPSDYSKVTSAAVPPVLGPPLPGDLGRPLLRAEQETGGAAVHSNRYDDQAHAEQVSRVREAEEAAKSPVVFKQVGPLGKGQPSPPTAGLDLTASTAKSNALPSANDPSWAANSDGASTSDPKQAFLDRPSGPASQSTSRPRPPASRFLVTAGTAISAALVTGINSDLPGPIVAAVTQSVFDSATGRYLLIPQGSRLIGRYDSQLSFGQRRLLMVWTRLILPDTSSVALDRLQGLDARGQAGLEDSVDWHWGRLLTGAGLSTLLGVGAELAEPQRGGGEGQVIIATRQGVRETANEVGKEFTKKNLDVQPTITVRPGFELRVMVNQDIVLPPYQFSGRWTQ